MTLKERYEMAKAGTKPDTPGAAFIKELAKVTKKSEIAVRRWVSNGANWCAPDELTQYVLAKHFKTTPEDLFPKN
ncbi:putative uncharacterized protein [Prevotella sp. CAG:1092]|jgi:hypothetical protein|nr:putative uncharacterized protein [Prevotella sp. CAG:1092]